MRGITFFLSKTAGVTTLKHNLTNAHMSVCQTCLPELY